MLRCAELGLSREDLADMTMGMVYDMLIERANDHEQYSIRATQKILTGFKRGVSIVDTPYYCNVRRWWRWRTVSKALPYRSAAIQLA